MVPARDRGPGGQARGGGLGPGGRARGGGLGAGAPGRRGVAARGIAGWSGDNHPGGADRHDGEKAPPRAGALSPVFPITIDSGKLWGEPWMILADPRLDGAAKCFSKLPHLLRLRLRNGVGPLVAGDIAFLAKHVLAQVSEGAVFRPEPHGGKNLGRAVIAVPSLRMVAPSQAQLARVYIEEGPQTCNAFGWQQPMS